jgi:hypothetical protein
VHRLVREDVGKQRGDHRVINPEQSKPLEQRPNSNLVAVDPDDAPVGDKLARGSRKQQPGLQRLALTDDNVVEAGVEEVEDGGRFGRVRYSRNHIDGSP